MANRGGGAGGGGNNRDAFNKYNNLVPGEAIRTHINNFRTNTLPNAENKIKETLHEMQPVLSNLQLKNLDEHKYSSTGSTALDPLFQPFWRWLVEQMPLYVAPNLITVIGLIINVVTSTILMIYSPNATDDPPGWSLLFCSFGLFVYQSLDAIDGKQARRTNSSSPLGELFDHGCDAVSTVFVIIALSVSLKLGSDPWLMFIICFLAMTAFYTAHWQTYVTGTLKFGKVDVTEAQVTVYSIYAITGLVGDSIWATKIPIINVQLRYIPVIVAFFGSFSSVLSNIKIISKGGKGKHGSSVANTSIVFPVFPMLTFLFLAFSIANKSQNIYLSNACLYTATFGIVWAKFTIKLIIAHMTKGEIFLWDSCLIGPIGLLLNQYFSNILPELLALYACLIFASVDLIKYCSKVCYQICTHMNIYLFKIPLISNTTSSTQASKPNDAKSH